MCQELIYLDKFESLYENDWYNIVKRSGTPKENPSPLFQLKLVYSYVIEVADSESDLSFHDKA